MLEFHGEEFRAGSRHAEAGRIGRPNAGGERLHERLEGFAAQSPNRKVLERFILGGRLSRADEPFTNQPQAAEWGEERCGQNAAEPSGGKQPETGGDGLRAALMKHQSPPHPRIDANQLAGQSQPFHQPDRLRPSREKAVGRPFDQPAIAPLRQDNPTKPFGGLDQRYQAGSFDGAFMGIGQQGLGGGQSGHSAANDDHLLRTWSIHVSVA